MSRVSNMFGDSITSSRAEVRALREQGLTHPSPDLL